MEAIQKRAFSLLEIVLCLSLLLLAASFLGFRWKQAIEKKRFWTDVEKCKAHIQESYHLALYQQSDWEVALEKGAKGWVCTARNLEDRRAPLFSSRLGNWEAFWGKEPVEERISWHFAATGRVSPLGVFSMREEDLEASFSLSELLLIETR